MAFRITYKNIKEIKVSTLVNFVSKGFVMTSQLSEELVYAANKDSVYSEIEKNLDNEKIIITSGYNLCESIMHVTVEDLKKISNVKEYIYDLYSYILEICMKNKISSICLPLVCSFYNNFPVDLVYEQAINAISNHLVNIDFDLYIVLGITEDTVFSGQSEIDRKIQTLFKEMNMRIVEKKRSCDCESHNCEHYRHSYLDKEEVFFDFFIKNIRNTHFNEIDVYKRGNIDRRMFAKIRNPNFYPTKKMLFSVAIALKYDLSTSEKLLNKYRYHFDSTCRIDIIVRYFIINKIYDIYQLDGYLFKYAYEQLCDDFILN